MKIPKVESSKTDDYCSSWADSYQSKKYKTEPKLWQILMFTKRKFMKICNCGHDYEILKLSSKFVKADPIWRTSNVIY